MPAAAVIPASVAYIKVAAVKRLVVGCQCRVSVRWTLEREDKSCVRVCVFWATGDSRAGVALTSSRP